MKNQIFFFTFSRSDYAAFRQILKINKDLKILKSKLVVGGSHLSKSFGNTINEIRKDKNKINFKIDYLKVNQKHLDTNQNLVFSNLIKIFSKFLLNKKVKNIFIIGDRWELVPLAISAFNNNVKIFHHSGGDYTLGSKDNLYRNIVSTLSNFHFVGNSIHKKRLEYIGIQQKNISVVGEPSLSNKIYKQIQKKKYILATLYPSDFEKINYLKQIKLFLNFLKKLDEEIILTIPGNEKGSKIFNKEIKKIKKKNLQIFKSLGSFKYNQIMSQAKLMIGNSSSGILEASSYKLPVLNIGNRQLGRLKPKNVIDSKFNLNEITKKYNKLLSKKFLKKIMNLKNPYYKKNCEIKILKKIRDNLNNNKPNIMVDTYSKFDERL
jgi:GDP/UDP-N,N'-diacetylbacillosamine 2-epimerase (hydrolysing)